MENNLRPCWRTLFKYNWQFGLFLILLFGIPRFIIVLQANVSGSYGYVFPVFMIMWFVPLLFLTKEGRKKVKIKGPVGYLPLFYSFVLGLFSCVIVFYIFYLLFGTSVNNAFTYIGKLNVIPGDLNDSNRLLVFLIASIPSMLFSPIGEELFYRGIVHGSFVGRFGERKAAVFDSMAFAVTHLAHFGIIYVGGEWKFLFSPSLLWVISMFSVCLLFNKCKQMCDSVAGAVLAHAGFNFAMMYFIFYHVL